MRQERSRRESGFYEWVVVRGHGSWVKYEIEMRVKDHVCRDFLSFVIFLRCSVIVFRLLDVCPTIYWIDIKKKPNK